MSSVLNSAARPPSRLGRTGVSRPEDLVDGCAKDGFSSDGRLVSVTELQQALREVRARRSGAPGNGRQVRSAVRPGGSSVATDAGVVDRPPADWVTVLAAHAGAGASTVALAVSDAAAAADRPVHLIETAHPARSGLVTASSAELGTDPTGAWRRGARSQVTIDRRADAPGLSGWPCPLTDGAPAVTVVDLGLLDETALPRLVGTGLRMVVVCRATLPGTRLTEQVLVRLDAAAVLVAGVGPRRWPREVTASFGPRLRALRDGGRVVPVPVDPRLEVTGLTSAPLPKPLLAAGRALLTQLEGARP